MKILKFFFLIISLIISSCAIDIVDLTGNIKVSVKDHKSGQFISGCTVSLSPGGKSGSTDNNGSYTFSDIEPGIYTVTFSKAGYTDQTTEVTVTAGEVVPLSVSLIGAFGGIKVIVKDNESGQFISGCTVSLSPGGKSGSTDSNGSYTFSDIEPGTYTVTFSKSGYMDQTTEIAVTAGEVVPVNVSLGAESETLGSIVGIVKDYNSGNSISNCLVSLSPSEKSYTTSGDGSYRFTSLEPGSYTLTFDRAGYNEETKKTTVKAGETVNLDVLLETKSVFTLSETVFDFGDLQVSKTFDCFNNSAEDCSYYITNVPEWASLNKIEGSISAGSNDSFTITVDRDKVSVGEYSQNITVNYSAGTHKGSETLLIKMEKVSLDVPTVGIASAAYNITKESFNIDGSIIATGGTQIISYGHCWSTSPEPTVSDNKTDLGNKSEIGTFTSTVSGLNVATTYYVRAYATNAQGTAYSEQITVVTQDLASNKWDGSIATSFAGGSGTSIDPYMIETGGQLLLMKDYSDRCFRLANNIDLNNNNWLPFYFSGELDGGGFQISNLFIDRNSDNLGLFSELDNASVSNLTIRGVKIEAGSYSNIGALAGGFRYGAIANCNVIVTENSRILGNTNVGGLIGSMGNGYGDSKMISNCEVTTVSSYNLLGETNVGGIVGYVSESYNGKIEKCYFKGSLKGTSKVGGIVGCQQYGELTIKECFAECKIEAVTYVGGLFGSCDHNGYGSSYIYASKSVVSIDVLNGGSYVGGIFGGDSRFMNVVACYSDGTITGNNATNVSGLAVGADCNLSYSTVVSDLSSFKQTGYLDPASSDNIGSYETANITQYLKDAYSEYSPYYNFNNTWTWTGLVDGSKVNVSCPKLAWE